MDMSEAPKDGTEIAILSEGTWYSPCFWNEGDEDANSWVWSTPTNDYIITNPVKFHYLGAPSGQVH